MGLGWTAPGLRRVARHPVAGSNHARTTASLPTSADEPWLALVREVAGQHGWQLMVNAAGSVAQMCWLQDDEVRLHVLRSPIALR